MKPIDPEIRPAFYAFWILAAICLWNLNGLTAIAFGVTRILSGVILLLCFVILSKSRVAWIHSLGRPGIWFFVMIAIYLMMGAVINFEAAIVISHINSLIIVLTSSVAAAYLIPRLGLQRFMTLIAIFSSLGALTVFLSPFLRPLYRNMEITELLINAGRWMGFFANPNETGLAGVYALSCCLALFSLTDRDSRVRRILPLLIVALGIGVFLSFSRGALIAFVFVGIAYAFMAVELTAQSVKVMFIAVLLMIGGFFFFTKGYKSLSWTSEQLNRIQSVERLLTGKKTSNRDLGGRNSGIKAGLHYWQKQPIFGHGLGKLHKMPNQYFRGLGCHNTHVMFLGEVGLFGFTFYFCFWLSLFLAAYYHPNPLIRQFCVMITISLFLDGMVGHNLLSNRNANVLLGVMLGAASLSPEMLGLEEEEEDCDLETRDFRYA